VSDQDKAAKRAQWEEINRAKAAVKQKEQDAPENAEPRANVTRKQFQAIRGTRDLRPPDSALWNRVEQTAHEVFGTFGFGEIRSPILEFTELFARAVGSETDIVSKEMYTFEDRPEDIPDLTAYADLGEYVSAVEEAHKRSEIPDTSSNRQAIKALREKFDQFATASQQLKTGAASQGSDPKFEAYRQAFYQAHFLAQNVQVGDSLALRPEGTASVCRAYVEHGMQQLPQPVRLYYICPMFRRERPQKGRYRQFYQIGAEVVGGSGAPSVDAEVIEMVMAFFRKVGLTGVKLEINSIGDQKCRPAYIKLLRDALIKRRDSFGEDSQRRIETNPLRVLDSKNPTEQETIELLPHITAHLCEDCAKNYEEVKHQLRLRQVEFTENWRLVRGLDYYVRTTFEVVGSGLGSQDAICGGGRYDGLIEMLGGQKNTKGIGFAIGEDRVIESLEQSRERTGATASMDVMVVGTSPVTWEEATRLGASLRRQGLRVYLPNSGTSISKAMDVANREQIRVAVIVGDNEFSANKYAIRILRPFTEGASKDREVDAQQIELYGRLVKLRNDLERKILGLLGESPTLFKGRALSQMIIELNRKGLVPGIIVDQLQNLIPQLNRSIHGDALGEYGPEWVLVVGNTILIELDRLREPLKESS
jgi:histidyl-tRNA synthetase